MKNPKVNCRIQFFGYFFGISTLLSPFAKGQNADAPVYQRVLPVTIRFDGGLGFLMSPRAMKLNFNSIGDANIGAFFHIAKGVNVGLNFRYTGFQVERNSSNFNDVDTISGASGDVVVTVPIHTSHNMFTPGITIGYDTWISDYSLFNFNICTGYSLVRYGNIRSLEKDYNPKPDPSIYNYNKLLIEPAVNFMYYFDDHSAMTIKLSYSRLFSGFYPERVALDKGAISYESQDLPGQIQFLSFGLGFVYSFKRVE
jgi:hypothetical protein